MINPYKPPSEPLAFSDDGELVARFHLTRSQLEHAKSKFLLRKYGTRLTILSLAMVALAIWVPAVAYSRIPGGGYVTMLASEGLVMVLAFVCYKAAIYKPSSRIDLRLSEFGITPGVECEFRVEARKMKLTSSRGDFESPLDVDRWQRTSRGLVLTVDQSGFWFLPKKAHFSTGGYARFVREMKQLAPT
ncbi:MAG: hypothetical protein AAFV88_12895 [Planctomycetota bacterium]